MALAAVAWLAMACARYENTPVDHSSTDEDDTCQKSDVDASCSAGTTSTSAGTSGRGGSASLPIGGTSSVAGKASSAGNGGNGGNGNAPSVGGSGGSRPEPSAGSAGQPGGAGAPTAGSGGNPTSGESQTWSFEQGAEGWTVRDQSPELSSVLTPVAGAVRLNAVAFSAAKQFVDVAFTFTAPADLRDRTLKATVQRVSGGFVGAQLYAYGAEWVSPGFESLSSGNVTVLSLPLDASMGLTPGSVARVGVKFGTGSNTTNTFATSTIELTEVTVE